MHNRHGIIGKSVIESVRRSLQNKYAEDCHIQQLIEELDSTEDLTYEELHITRQAYEEVKARLFYTALLDSLWQEIDETQDLLEQLHVYDSLEDEFDTQGEELTSEEMNIDEVDLADVDVSDRPVALRQSGAVAARQDGTVVARRDGSVVSRQEGAVANRQDGSVVLRQEGTLVAEPMVAKTQAVAADAITDRDIPWANLTQGADADDNLLAGTNAVLNSEVVTANSAATAEEDDNDDDTNTVFPASEIFLQDILDMLSQNLPDGKEGPMTIEDLMLHTEWKEFKKLAKQAKKSIKKAHKAAKKEAKKVAKEAEKAAKAAEKETKKALKKAKHAKKECKNAAKNGIKIWKS